MRRSRVTRSARAVSSGNGAIPPDPMAAGALLLDDRRDVAREARLLRRSRRSCVDAASATSGSARPRATAASAVRAALRDGLRMLGVICTPKLAERAADLADRAARPQRLAHGRQEVRVALGGAAHLGERRGGGGRRPAPRERDAVRSRWRRSISGSTWRSSTRSSSSSVNSLTPTTTRSPDSTSRLVAERRRLDLGLDESLLDRGDGAAELVDARDQLLRAPLELRR